jgi:hypothetical protein
MPMPTKHTDQRHIKSAQKAKRWRGRNPDKVRARNKAWYAANKKESDEKSRAYYHAHKESAKLAGMMYRHGLTQEAYESMLAGQGNVCAICGTSEWPKLGPEVDHDHDTGEIRGILCHKCNWGLGLLGDKKETLALALGYLNANNKITLEEEKAKLECENGNA